MKDFFNRAYEWWRATKQFLEFGGLVSTNHLHIIFGLLIFVGIYTILRFKSQLTPVRTSLIGVIVVQSANEALDISFRLWRGQNISLRNSAWDFFFTLAGPITLIAAASAGLYCIKKYKTSKLDDDH